MSRNLIEIKNEGIHILRNKFNQNFHYESKNKYYEKNNTFYIEEYEEIDIYTNYNDVNDVYILLKEIKLTDIFIIFNTIRIHSLIKGIHFRNDELYFIEYLAINNENGEKIQIDNVAIFKRK